MRFSELNPARLPFLFKRQFEMSAVKQGETIALVSDLKVRPELISAAFAAASELGASVYELKLNMPYSTTHIGGEQILSIKGGIELIEAADLCVVFHIPLGSDWMARGQAAGTRFLMIYDHPDDLERLLSPPGLKEACIYTRDLVHNAREMVVKSAAGTDFRCDLGDMNTTCQYGFSELPGRVDHWGAGHFSTWPNVGTAEGTIVLQPGDCWILPYVRLVEDTVTLSIEKSVIVDIKGKADAFLLRQFMDAHRKHGQDNEPYAVSHLGWGLNPTAIWDQIAVHGNDIERVGGTGRSWPGSFLFSTGPNDQGGGTNNTKAHIDLPMFGCSVWIDGTKVIDTGAIVDPKMKVESPWTNKVAYSCRSNPLSRPARPRHLRPTCPRPKPAGSSSSRACSRSIRTAPPLRLATSVRRPGTFSIRSPRCWTRPVVRLRTLSITRFSWPILLTMLQ